jgi:hypothetical protein
MYSNASEARRLWKLMSSDASEVRRLRPDRRKRSNDHDISNHNYTCRDEQALHVLIHMSLERTAWALLPLGLCFGVCLSGRDGNYIYVGEGNGRKDEESVLCVNCDTSHPVPGPRGGPERFIDFWASDASSAFSASRRETGEASSILRVECSGAMHNVKTAHPRQYHLLTRRQGIPATS